MGNDLPKQFLPLGGKALFMHVLEKLYRSGLFARIMLSTLESHFHIYQEAVDQAGMKNIVLVPGGKTRQASSYEALKEVDAERVMIHVASRPVFDKDFLRMILSYPDPAVIPVLTFETTIAEGDAFMTRFPDQARVKNVQMPQAFDTQILREAHEKARAEDFRAQVESTLVFHIGAKVRFVEGRKENIKITDSFDLLLAEKILQAKGEIQA
jgi:2-C-methyl-D-erythritol 4-phosphate cytidylyltransferase